MLSLIMLLNRTGGMVIPFMTVYLTTVLGFETDEAGLVMSCFGVGALLGSVIGGWLTDKIGAFHVQFFTLLFTAPVFIILSFLHTVQEVCLAIFVLSLVNECFRPANSAAIASYAKKGNLTRAFSLNRMSINLGFSFGPALGGFLASISYSWLFYGNSITTFLTAVVFFLYFFRRKERNEAVEEADTDTSFTEEHEGSPYLDKWFLVFSFFCFLYACAFFQLLSILPMYYKEDLSFGQQQIGFILGFNGLFVVIMEMIVVQYAESKFNIYISIILGCLSLLIAYAWLLADHSMMSCYISMMFLSLSEILVLPFISTVAAKRSSEKKRGAYMGVNGLSISMAFIIMPYLATKLIKNYSYDHLWIINVIVLAIAVSGFLFTKKKMPLHEN